MFFSKSLNKGKDIHWIPFKKAKLIYMAYMATRSWWCYIMLKRCSMTLSSNMIIQLQVSIVWMVWKKTSQERTMHLNTASKMSTNLGLNLLDFKSHWEIALMELPKIAAEAQAFPQFAQTFTLFWSLPYHKMMHQHGKTQAQAHQLNTIQHNARSNQPPWRILIIFKPTQRQSKYQQYSPSTRNPFGPA